MTPLEKALKTINKPSVLPGTGQLTPSGNNPLAGGMGKTGKFGADLAKSFSYKVPEPEGGDINFGGIFGDIIDVIDTPRAAIASTIQEVVDVFQGEGFSPSDWWKQTSNNHLFGQIMRDVGVDLPGPLDFVLGTGLDIAFDPLTYLAGAGVAARLTKADDVVRALREGSAAAKKLGDTTKAKKLFEASEKVRKSRSVLSAGKEGLQEIGISPGMRLTLPGTGRLGRNIIEKPLDFVSGGALSKKLNTKRVDQLKKADFLFEEAGLVSKNSDEIAKAMKFMRSGDEAAAKQLAALSPEIRKAATMASKMPVETRLRLPWSTPLVAAVAAGPGRVLRLATQKKLVDTLDQALNTKKPIRAMKVGNDPDMGLAGIYLERGMNKGEITARKISSRLTEKAKEITQEAKRLNVPFEELLRASSRPFKSTAMPPSISGLGDEGLQFHNKLVDFWKEAETVVNETTGKALLQEMIGDMYSARFLSEEGAQIVGVGNFREFIPKGVGGLQRRTLITPSNYDSKAAGPLGPKKTAEMYTTKHFGDDIMDVTGPKAHPDGLSVEDQMEVIGKKYMGEEDYKSLFSDDWVDVIPRYINRMSQFGREQTILSYLEDFGVLVKGGVGEAIERDLGGRLEQIKNLGKSTKKSRIAARKNATAANSALRNAQSKYSDETASILSTTEDLQLQLDDLMQDVLDNTSGSPQGVPLTDKKIVVDVQKNLASRSKQYSARKNELGRQLQKLERIVRAVSKVRAGTQNPQMFTTLNKTIKEIGDALTIANADQLSLMMTDETVVAGQRLQELLAGELGGKPFDLKTLDPTTQRFKNWEEIYKLADQIDDDIGASKITMRADSDFLAQARRRIREQRTLLNELKDSGVKGPAARALASDVADPGRFKLQQLQEDAMDFQEQLLRDNERLIEEEILRQSRLATTNTDEATLLALREMDIANNVRSLEADIATARATGRTSELISAADTQEQALKIFKDRRQVVGFTEAFNEGLSNQILGEKFGNYLGVPAGETAELFQSAFMAAARINNPQALGEFGKSYSKLLNWWKAQAVASTGFILRNMMGGAWINSQIAGVEMGVHSKVVGLARAAIKAGNGDMRIGARVLKDAGKSVQLDNVFGVGRTASARDLDVFNEMVDAGIASGGQAWSEVEDALFDLGLGGTWNPFSAQFRPFRGIRKANEKAEFMLRGSVAFDAMANKGKSIDDAWDLVRKYHFDYSDLTNTERKIKMVIPFWKWQKSVLPVLVESIGKNPKAWGRLQQLKGELELTSDEENLVPDYFGKSMGIRLPFKWGDSRVYTLPDLPFKDLKRFTESPTAPFRGLAEGAVPFLKLPIEIWSGKQVFGNMEFSGRYQQVPNSFQLLPGFMQTLEKLGKAKKNYSGDWKMRDRDIHIFDSFMPVLGRVRRLFPNEESKQKRLITSWASFLVGGGLRFNDERSKQSAWFNEQKKADQDFRDMEDIEFREI